MSKKVIEHIATISLAIENCKERMDQPLAGEAERWYSRCVLR